MNPQSLADLLLSYTDISESGRNDDGIEGVAIPGVDCYDFDEVMRQAAAEVRCGGWLPIESAPKDGSLYLCWVDAIRYGERDDGSLDQASCSEVDFGQWRDFETGGAHMNMMGNIGDSQQITHWQPLPSPPGAVGD